VITNEFDEKALNNGPTNLDVRRSKMLRRIQRRRRIVTMVLFAFVAFLGCSTEVSDPSDVGAEADSDLGDDAEVGEDTVDDDANSGDMDCESGADCTSYTQPYCAENGRCSECLFDMHCASDNCKNDSHPYECECVAVGESCSADRDCCSGKCGDGICRSESCGVAGKSCQTTTDCCGKNECTDSGKCEGEECATEGETCEETDCCGGLTCSGLGGSGMRGEKTCKR